MIPLIPWIGPLTLSLYTLTHPPMICREPRYTATRIERIGYPGYWICARAPRVPKGARR